VIVRVHLVCEIENKLELAGKMISDCLAKASLENGCQTPRNARL
jgi:hypothetical protein